MTDKNGGKNFSKNDNSEDVPDPSSDINLPQEQQRHLMKASLRDKATVISASAL